MANRNNNLSDEKIKGASGGKVQQSGKKYNILDNSDNRVIASYDNKLDAEKGDFLYHKGKDFGILEGRERGFWEGVDMATKEFKHLKK